MLRFGRKSRVPNYLSRSQQRRLLILGLLLLLVLVAMQKAADPNMWKWFTRLSGQPEERVDNAEDGPIDNRVARRRPPDDLPGTIHANDEDEPPVVEISAEGYFPGVQPALLARIKDNMPHRAAEHEAFYHLLKILQKNRQQSLVEASSGDVTYRQLYWQPESYRGKLVTLHGEVRRARRIESDPVAREKYGITGYYETWLQPADKLDTPMQVCCLELPDGFPLGTEISAEVRVTGFFFKRWLYQGKRDIYETPLVLAKTLKWIPPQPEERATIEPRMIPWLIGVAGIISLGLLSFLLTRSRLDPEASASNRIQKTGDESVRTLEAAGVEPGPEVEEQLAEMEREAANAPPEEPWWSSYDETDAGDAAAEDAPDNEPPPPDSDRPN